MYQWIILSLGFLVSETVAGQIIPVAITSPGQVAACDSNRFHASFTASSTFSLKISASILTGNQNTLNYSCQDSTPVFPVKLIVDTVGNSSVSGAIFNSLDSSWVFSVNNTGSISFDYYILVDCSVIQDSSFNNSINLNQIWTCQGCSFSFDLDSTTATSNSLTSSNIKTPRIIDVSNTTFPASYQNSSPLYFEYRNNGNAYAPIQFNYNPNSSGTNCDAFVSDSLHFGIKDSIGVVSTWYLLSPNSWMTAFIPINRSLVIRNSIRVLDCLSPCTSQKSSFKWRCAFTDTTDPRLCKDCQDEYISTYTVSTPNTMKAKLKLERIDPTLDVAKADHSCPGTYVHWRYRITNTGTEDIPLSHAELYYYGQVDRFSDLSLIPRDSINWDLSGCPSCSIDTSSILKDNFLCQQIYNPVERFDITIKELGGGEYVEFSFATYKCSSEDDTLLNVTKYFNQWIVGLTGIDSCGASIDKIPAPPANIPYLDLNNPDSGPISSHLINKDSDLNLQLEFIPTVTDLTVPKDSTFGPVADLSMNLHGMFPSSYDYQLLGCSLPDSATCQLQGFLRANVHCETGLRVENMATDVWLSHPDSGSMTPIYFYSSVPQNVCASGDYYFYFNLSDSAAFTIINSGKLNFRLQSCCGNPNDEPTHYSVTYSLLPNPSSCFTLGPQDSLTVPPHCLDCNWIPLSSSGNSVSVHCPGCRQPGMIVDSYKMERLTYGFEDADNDRVADAPLQVIEKDSSYFQNHSIRSFVSMHGDYVQDLMVAHFEPGVAADSLDPTGYTYTQMIQSPNSALLDYLQLSRKIGESSALSMDLHPMQMLFYIDVPDTVSTMCLDCDDFQLNNLNYKTIQINSVDSSSITTFLSITADSVDNYYFYSFDVDSAGPQTLLNHVVYSDPLSPFTAFYEGQRFRMKVIYRNCGNFLPANLVAAESDDGFRESQINNVMWLSGKNQGYNALGNVPFKPDTLPPGILDSTFSNGFLFICEVFGGRHYFVSNSSYNLTTLQAVNGELCNRRIVSQAYQLIGGDGKTDRFPYEFRTPVFHAKSFEISAVPGFIRTTTRVKSSFKDVTQTNFFHSATLPLTITIPPNPNPITIPDSAYPPINCITQIPVNSGDSSLYAGDQFSRIEIQIDLLPVTCQVGFTYIPDTSFSTIQFSDYSSDCGAVTDTLICGTTSFSSSNKAYTTLELPYPLLALSVNDSVTYNNQVCWELTYTNPHVDSIAGYGPFGNNASTYAPFVYLYVPDSVMLPQLSNWQFTFNGGGTISPDSNGFFHISNHFLSSNSGQINGQLCASINTCEELNSLQVLWGWNCLNYPTTTDSLCYSQTDTLLFSPPPAGLNTPGKMFNPPVVLCDTLTFGASFASTKTGAVFTDSLFLGNMPPFFTIVDVQLINCKLPGNSIPLNSNLTSWAITDSMLIGLGYPNGFLNLDDSVCVQIRAVLQCNFRNILSLPDIILNGHTSCDSLLNASANFSNNSLELDSTSCTDCFTLSKTAIQDTVYAGDTTAFQILICGINNASQSVILTEYLPSDFTLTSTIPYSVNVPAQGCDTILVNGYFSTPGSCSDSIHINRVQIITSMSDTITDTACMEVLEPCVALSSFIIPDSASASSYGSSISNTTFFVSGIFFIDASFTLNNCTVYTAAGAQIIVLPGDTLILNGTTISGCLYMWQGVTLDTTAGITLLNASQIRDADKGVFAGYNSTVDMVGSDILDCVTGIYTPPASGFVNTRVLVSSSRIGLNSSSFKPAYTGQPVHGVLPKAGIEVNNLVMTLGGTGVRNEFFKMNTGIVAHNSNLVVRNTEFRNMGYDTAFHEPYRGTAMVSVVDEGFTGRLTVLPEPTSFYAVHDCHRAIYTDRAVLFANYVHLIDVYSGIYGTNTPNNQTTQVNGCTITTKTYGIFWINNRSAKFMIANNNHITVNGSANTAAKGYSKTAIYMTETMQQPVVFMASGNSITLNNANNGIYSGNQVNAKIKFNIIKMTTSSTGIGINNNSRTSVSCNYILGDYSGSGSVPSMGFVTGNSSNRTALYCNTTDSTYRGFYFGGANPNTVMKGNDMKYHFDGLYLNNGGTYIGPQPHSGNRWLGPFNSFGGVNMASQFWISSSRFDVDSTLGSVYNPIVNPPTGWFHQDTTGTTFYCDSSIVCELPPPSLSQDEINELIASGTLFSEEYAEETRAIAEEYLYRELMDDSVLRYSDSLYIEFMLENQGEPVAYLYDAEEYLRAATAFDSVFTSLLTAANNQIDDINDTLQLIDEGVEFYGSGYDYGALREQLLHTIDFLNQTISNLYSQAEVSMSGSLADAEIRNDLVVPETVPEENSQFLNETEIEFIESAGNPDVIINRYAQLLIIAHQCPYTGGPAVERARSYIAMINDSMEYFDDDVCLQVGVYRNASETFDQVSTNFENHFDILPNPAQNQFEVRLNYLTEDICQINIRNSQDKNIFTKNFPCKDKFFIFDSSNWLPGIYLVTVMTDKTFIETHKLVIVK